MSDELDRQAAACILASFPGHEVPAWARRWLERGLGGIVLFADNVGERGQLSGLTAALRAERPDLVIAIDEEGGDVTRLEATSGSSYPGNLALGVVDDPALTARVGESIARELAAAGVTMNLAPVADVNSNPLNPVIGVRSFGADPDLVARHVGAFVAGTQGVGVAACAKHFPGHGDTHGDSHLELPTVEGGRDELARGALVPFRAAVEAGVRAVMTAHISVPRIDAAPATVSPAIVTGLLRSELGFDGLVISDALEMRALAGTVGVEEGAVRAIAAGVDALCLGHDVDEGYVERIHGALLGAVQSGSLAAERVGEAAQAVGHAVSAADVDVDGRPDRSTGAEAARRAVRGRGEFALRSAPLVIELVPDPMVAAGAKAHGLGEALAGRWPDTDVVALYGPPADTRAVLGSARKRSLVVVLRDAARHEWQQSVARALVGERPDAVIVETGLPGWLPEDATAFVETHGAGRVNLEAAAELLAGE